MILSSVVAYAQHDTLAVNARFQSLLNLSVHNGLPGVSLRVIGSGIDFEGASGIASLKTGEPMSTNHTLYLASLGKTFTATVALKLCEDEILKLFVATPYYTY